MGGSEIRIRPGKLRVQRNRLLEERPRLRIIPGCIAPIELGPAHEILPGYRTTRVGSSHVRFLLLCQPYRQRPRDPPGDLLLHRKDILYVPVVRLRPHMVARRGVHQLRGDPHSVIGFAHTPLQHIPHPQVPTDLIRLHRPPLVGEDGFRAMTNSPERLESSVMRILRHPVAEIFLFRVAAHVDKWQHGDSRLGGQ